MVNFKCEKVSEHVYRLLGLGDACMYYIKGDNSGLLLDTAYGVGDLKSFVDTTFKQSYEVILTHGHADHCNGIGQWDKVYMNLADEKLYYTKTSLAYRKAMLKRTVSDIEDYPDEAFIKPFTGKFIDLKDNDCFELGNLSVKAVSAPGHTQGMMVMLVLQDRVALFGDACGTNTFLFKDEASTVLEYKTTLAKLKEYEPLYDRVLRNHGSFESEKSILYENLEVADEILAGKDDRIGFEYMGQPVWIAKKADFKTGKREDGKSGNIWYIDEKIR